MAVVRPNATSGMVNPDIHPILTDHLGTPRKVLDGSTGQVRWEWDAKEPFGHQAPNQTPTAGLPAFSLDLRFPGQRYDESTGLFQNGFRDYHAGLGRYVQSDPLGLEAGWNMYGYGEGNPTGSIDPRGLKIIGVGSAEQILEIKSALTMLRRSPTARAMLNRLEISKHEYKIGIGSIPLSSSYYSNSEDRYIHWDQTDTALCLSSLKVIDPLILLSHEIAHAYEDDMGWLTGSSNSAENRAFHLERKVAQELGLKSRENRFLSIQFW